MMHLSRTTAWRTLSGVTKHKLADAMANGKFGNVMAILNTVGVGAAAVTPDIQVDNPNNRFQYSTTEGIPVEATPGSGIR
jgi:hypothetical protein